MQTKSDTELLRDYATTGSEAAFGEIVRRYADLVYSAALRQVGVSEQARDVAQTVFVDLARKARSISPNTLLIGWLHHGARLAALAELRSDRRRLDRERQAMDLLNSPPDNLSDWSALCPVLDEAIASLGEEDRHAVLLRFFKKESLAAVGAALDLSDDAAQKRVSRALDKLRQFFAQLGIHTTASALAAMLTANAIQGAPSNFAVALTAGALAKVATVKSSGGSFLKLFTLTNMKTAMLIVVLAGGVAGLAVLHLRTSRQLQLAQALSDRQAEELAVLRSTNEQLTAQAATLAQLRNQAKELPTLRGEVAQLRRERAEQKAAVRRQSEPNSDMPENDNGPEIRIDAKFVSVPTESLKSFEWSRAMATVGGISFMMDPEATAAFQNLATVEGMQICNSAHVQTANGVEGALFSGESVPLGGTNVPVGVNLHVNPHYSTNSTSVELDIAAELSQLVDTSPQQDNSQPTWRAASVTNSLTLLDGQTVVLRQDISGDGHVIGSTNSFAGPKSLLVFLAPHILRDAYLQRLEKNGGRN